MNLSSGSMRTAKQELCGHVARRLIQASVASGDEMNSHVNECAMQDSLLYGSATRGIWWQDMLLFLARLYAGVTIASAGHAKLPTPDWMAQQVTDIGLPAPELFATLACLSEFIFGILLAIGFLTRPAAGVLAIVMGVASFGFHRVMPITGMHIAQGFAWLFAVFLAVGGGRISIDALVRSGYARSSGRKPIGLLLGLVVMIAACGYAGYRELFVVAQRPSADIISIESASLAGTFNDWDLTATPMAVNGERWLAEVRIDQPGPVQFKVAANGSWDTNIGSPDSKPLSIPAKTKGVLDAGNLIFIAPSPGTYRFSINPTNFEVGVDMVGDSNDGT